MGKITNVVLRYLVGLLRPIARLCLAHGIRMQEFERATKLAFLEAAQAALEEQGHEINTSRLATMTGLQRRDVVKLEAQRKTASAIEPVNVMARILSTWSEKRAYCSATGKARTLSCEGAESEFARLVREVSKDLNPYTALFELERLGSVLRKDGKVKLVEQAVQLAPTDKAQGLELLANDSADLIGAVTENVFSPSEVPNLHISTFYDDVVKDELPRIRRWLVEQGAEFHKRVRDYLAAWDRDLNPALQKQHGGGRVVVGTFSRTSEVEQ